MSNLIFDKNRLRDLFIEKVDLNKDSFTKVESKVMELLESLTIHYFDQTQKKEEYINLQTKFSFSTNQYFALFGLIKDEKDNFAELELEKEDKYDSIKKCIPNKISIKRFYSKKVVDVKGISLDFYGVYLGYAGWKGFQNNVSIAKCFYIDKTDAQFKDFDINGFQSKREIVTIVEKLSPKKTEEKTTSITKTEVISSGLLSSGYDEIQKKINGISLEILNIIANTPLYVDYVNKQNMNLHFDKAVNKTHIFLTSFFNQLVKSKNIGADLDNQIKILLGEIEEDIKFDWPHRVVLSSGLSLSLINGWSIEKVRYLVRLAQIKNEPLVSERAIIGLTLALLVSNEKSEKINNSRDFIRTVREIKKLEGIETRIRIYETLNYFWTKWKTEFLETEDSMVYNNIVYKEQYQYFEPPHQKNSSYQLDNLKFKNLKRQKKFFRLLNNSISLNHFEKIKVLVYLNGNPSEENNIEFMKIFEGERIKWKELGEVYSDEMLGASFINHLESFNYIILKLDYYKECLDELFSKVDINKTVQKIFKYFPNYRYVNFLSLEMIQKRIKYEEKTYLNIVNTLEKINRNKEAIAGLDLILEAKPKLTKFVYQKKALLLIKMNRNEEALKIYDLILEMNPKDETSYSNKAVLLAIMNRNEQALHNYNLAIKVNPRNQESYYKKANFLAINNKHEEALKNYDLAIKVNPKNQESYYKKANLLAKNNRREEALKNYDLAIKVNPKYEDAHYGRANLLLKMNRTEDALLSFDSIIEINPKDKEVYLYKALALSQLSRYEEAMLSYDLAIKKNSKNQYAYIYKALLLSEINRYEEAIQNYDIAIKINPKNEDAYLRKALVLLEINKYAEAIRNYDLIIKINPLFSEAYLRKAKVLCIIKKSEEALKTLNKASKKIPNYPKINYTIGWIYFTKGEFLKAKQYFKKTLKFDKIHETAYMNLGHCCLVLNDKKEAKKNYKKSLDLFNCSNVFFEGFEQDWKYLKSSKIYRKEYNSIKKELEKYCEKI